MTYGTYESSLESGRPIRFYRFTLGSAVWRYTNADEDLTIGGVKWKACAISDDGIRESGEATSDSLGITAPNNIGPAAVFAVSAPATEIAAEILMMHEDMVTPNVCYVGAISQINFNSPNACRITCQTLRATMRRQGLRLGWQRTCPYMHYDPLTCKVPKGLHAVQCTVQSVSGLQVTVNISGHADQTFAGGFAEWTHPVRGIHAITIEAQTGTVLSMFDDTSDMYPGLEITIYKGCSRTEDACKTFDNILHYGGYSKMPGKSPFDGLNTPFF
jgi:uncharacterized phage protein (TIGR02218 family)